MNVSLQVTHTRISHGEYFHMETTAAALTILFHGQEQNLVTEPSLWLVHLYGTVYQQQFVKLTACIHSSASSKLICLLSFNDWLSVLYILQAFVMHSLSSTKQGGHNNCRSLAHLLTYTVGSDLAKQASVFKYRRLPQQFWFLFSHIAFFHLCRWKVTPSRIH